MVFFELVIAYDDGVACGIRVSIDGENVDVHDDEDWRACQALLLQGRDRSKAELTFTFFVPLPPPPAYEEPMGELVAEAGDDVMEEKSAVERCLTGEVEKRNTVKVLISDKKPAVKKEPSGTMTWWQCWRKRS